MSVPARLPLARWPAALGESWVSEQLGRVPLDLLLLLPQVLLLLHDGHRPLAPALQVLVPLAFLPCPLGRKERAVLAQLPHRALVLLLGLPLQMPQRRPVAVGVDVSLRLEIIVVNRVERLDRHWRGTLQPQGHAAARGAGDEGGQQDGCGVTR
eukprot:scaffold3263_cov129-Isochrysis_galbana.AAC.5